MKLPEFLDFNRRCPVCDNPLSLYMQWVGSICFKSELIDSNSWAFNPHIGLKKEGDPNAIERDDYMLLVSDGANVKTRFSANKIYNEGKKHHMYFYYLCNPEGIQKTNWGDYKINIYKGCYYRASPLYEFQRDDDQESKNWSLRVVNGDFKDIINKHETYAFHKKIDNLEKVYILDLNWEKQETILWYYSVTDEQIASAPKDFKPNDFEKTLPLLKNRPKVGPEDRNKLLDRFDSWIIMS